MRTSWLPAISLATVLAAMPGISSAQIYFGPPVIRIHRWRPRVVFMPPPVMVRVAPAPYCCAAPPAYGCCQVPAAPAVVVQPEAAPLPPPPVYQQQPYYQQPYYQQQPVYQAPPPVYQPPPPVYQAAAYAPPPPAYQARPGWRSRFGIGGRFAGLINRDGDTRFSQLGFGGDLLFRAARRLSLELGVEYQRRIDDGLARYDIPVTLGLRVHGPPEWVVSPYLVVAGGLDYANLDFLHAHDVAWFIDGQLGVGLEVRLGQHVALTGDVRGDARHRMTAPDDATAATISVNGKPFQPMQDQLGLQFRLGAAVYF